MSLQGKVIIVTGGTKGVGRGVAESAGANGAKVVISGRCEEDGFEVCDFIRNKHKGEAIFVKGDLRKPEVCENLVNQAIAKYGKVDGLVNYAGVLPASALPNTEESEFDDVFDINVKAAFFCTKFVLRAMMENGGGSIVFIGSVHA
ncbi:MAG: SDR family oxidoreductase [Clostridiaceae bacterium]|nr:SDR family oxidoreductase [Clostridiaceae bacterium]